MMSTVDDTSDASNNKSVIILAQVQVTFTISENPSAASDKNKTATIFAQKEECQPINLDLVFINNKSTVDLFTYPDHVQNIHPAKHPICILCNKGMLATTEEANFGDTPVYYGSCAIANVLSMYHLDQKLWITYDSSDCGGIFQTHTKKGIVEFKPTKKGLHALNLKDNPDTAYLLVNNAELLLPMPDNSPAHQIYVNIVCDNYKGYSHNQMEQAMTAQRLMNMVATPSACDFQGLVCLNLLKDCPVTNDDIKTAHTIFGPDLATIRGKTVWRKPTRVITDYGYPTGAYGMVQAWVGQKHLKCDILKTFFDVRN
jgi:hypothetical protein